MHARFKLALLLAVTATSMLLGAAPTLAAGSAGSTREYIQADLALVQSARAHLAAAEAAPLKVLAQVRRECPRAAASSPQDPESTQVSNEVIGAMVLTAYHLDLPAIHAFVTRVQRLSWSSSALTGAVRSYAGKLRTLAALAPPPLCTDVRAWAADGFSSLPASTVRFDRVFMPAWVAVGELPGQLARFERPEDRPLLARAQAIEGELTEGEARAVENWGHIMNELEVEP